MFEKDLKNLLQPSKGANGLSDSNGANPLGHADLSYLAGVSPDYLESLIRQYLDHPESVPYSWRIFFDGLQLGLAEVNSGLRPKDAKPQEKVESATQERIFQEQNVITLIQSHRLRGHLMAWIDPLSDQPPPDLAALNLSHFSLDGVAKGHVFQAAELIGLQPSPLDTIVAHLRATYCSSIGVEYLHISDEPTKKWLESRMEPTQNKAALSPQQKIQFYNDLVEANGFEEFLQKNFTGQKRFSLEGGESLIPALKQIVRVLASAKVKEVVVGMAHRGRLNVLVNVFKKPYSDVFKEFAGIFQIEDHNIAANGSGDVKYHLGFSSDVDVNGQKMHMTLAFNPSHLEAIAPVVQGMTRARTEHRFGGNTQAIVPIVIHGDAAVIGQGVVTETLNLSGLNGYSTGGTIHLIVNNQVGFTTLPEEARSTLYCTDFAKAIQAPIFHVNGEDIEAVVHVVQLAAEFRMSFGRDVFVDLMGYRKYGHNEGDEPRFTQPIMYEKIAKKKRPHEIYLNQLSSSQVIASEEAERIVQQFHQQLEIARGESNSSSERSSPRVVDGNSGLALWQKFQAATEDQMTQYIPTPINEACFQEIVEVIHNWPGDFEPLPKLRKMLELRRENIQKSGNVDWAVAEQLAFGSLLKEGLSVRLSGQDSKRGTFSHRHAELVDHRSGKSFQALKTLESESAKFLLYNSPLSEFAVLGFEFGYSLSAPDTLTLWEAQFGDFTNGAQVVLDQFLVATEAKWARLSGCVLLLPHGYEGQGPEHSSARLERFLQMAGEANIQVAYPTTPAQFCHLLRRQMHRSFRKPLVVMTPKSPLRMAEVISPKSELTSGGFKNILISGAPLELAQQVIFCSGKIYWDLIKKVVANKSEKKTSLVRLEQIYPLDVIELNRIRDQGRKIGDWVWCQEEPQNMGAWSFVFPYFLDLGIKIRYAGRKAAASPATGSSKVHLSQQEDLLRVALKNDERKESLL